MNKLFVDTAGWLALVNRSDTLHTIATKIYQERFEAGWSFVTHTAVMLEVGNGLSKARFRHLAVSLKERLASSPRVEIKPVTEDLDEAGWQLFAARSDKDWGVVDCIVFVLMKDYGITEALTTDHHFEQAGFIKLL